MRQWRCGSLILIVAVALVPAVTSLMLTMNYGQATQDRHAAQDGADALAGLHATWTARSLNQISMNNVEAAQLLTVAIGSEALDGALDALALQSTIALAEIGTHSRKCPGFRLPKLVAICFAMHVYYLSYPVASLVYVSGASSEFDPVHGIRLSHDGLSAIDAMNQEIVDRFPRAMGEVAQDYLADLGLDAAHYGDPCATEGRCGAPKTLNGRSLPVEPGGLAARASVCLGMRLGTFESRTSFSQKGFRIGTGPMSAGGSSANPDVQKHINEETQIGRELQWLYDYLRGLYMIAPSGADKYPRRSNFAVQQRDGATNEFSLRFTAKETELCTGVGVPIYGLEAPVPEFWSPKGGSIFAGSSPRSMPDPYHVLAIAQVDRSERVGLALLQEPQGGHFAYAQAVTYNPDGVSLFSQNWRAERVPASNMDAPHLIARDLQRNAATAFDPLAAILAPLSGPMETLNAH